LSGARGLSVLSTATTFTVSVDSAGQGGSFSVERRPTGEVVRACTNRGAGTCAADGSW
jgi:hypothetical protein